MQRLDYAPISKKTAEQTWLSVAPVRQTWLDLSSFSLSITKKRCYIMLVLKLGIKCTWSQIALWNTDKEGHHFKYANTPTIYHHPSVLPYFHKRCEWLANRTLVNTLNLSSKGQAKPLACAPCIHLLLYLCLDFASVARCWNFSHLPVQGQLTSSVKLIYMRALLI
jgi:hypothetical protein